MKDWRQDADAADKENRMLRHPRLELLLMATAVLLAQPAWTDLTYQDLLDGKEVPLTVDNCSAIADHGQPDSDGDGFRDACDADYDNDGVVSISDLDYFREQFGLTDTDPAFDHAVDHSGDGTIGITDFEVLRSYFGNPIAFSAVSAPTGPVPPPVNIDLIWSATTGAGATGTSTIAASPGDELTLDVVLNPDERGVHGYGISIEFDRNGKELTITDAIELLPEGFEFNFTPGPGDRRDSTPTEKGFQHTFEAATIGDGPTAGPLLIGQAFFTAVSPVADGDDVFSGLFNVRIDGLFDNMNNDLSAEAIFGTAEVNLLLQNLVVNPGFDTDVSGWDNIGSNVPWSSFDRNDDPGSGSAQQNVIGAPGGGFTLYSCAGIRAGSEYAYGASVFVPGGITPGTLATAAVFWWDNADCSFPSGSVIAVSPELQTTTTSTWVDLSGDAVAPPGALGGQLRIGYTNGGGDQAMDMLFWDDAFLVPEPGVTAQLLIAITALLAVREARMRRLGC